MEGAQNKGNWSDDENDQIVADYFDMLGQELAGKTPVKAHHNRVLSKLIGRTSGSIERKHMNISAVLERLGLPRINGYKPYINFQKSLIDAIERHLSGEKLSEPTLIREQPLNMVRSPESLWVGPAPQPNSEDLQSTPELERLIRKFDPAERDARNRELGKLGEELIFNHERRILSDAGRPDLSRQVEWTSQERGDGAGYDIASFTLDGAPRLIEVKTTNGPARTPFMISENERMFSEESPKSFRLMRIFNFSRQPGAFELQPPLSACLLLSPINYRATIQ